YFLGRAQTELAAEAGVAPSTITHRLERAIERLRKHLKAMGCVATTAVGGAVVANFIATETASAAVPPALTANVMKIGLSGVGSNTTAATVGTIAFATALKSILAAAALIA